MIALFAAGMLLLFLDQWSKETVQLFAPNRCLSWVPFLRVRYVRNLNKMYQGHSTRSLLVLVWFASVVSAIFLHRSGFWFQGQASLIGLGLAFSGAAGNLLDILRHRFVIDFIDLGWWPVFNFADLGIIGGLLLAFCC